MNHFEGLFTDFLQFPWIHGSGREETNSERLLNTAWKPALSVIGVDGIPSLVNAGNVLRPYTTLTLSVRLPPTVDANEAAEELKKILLKDPPYNAKVTVNIDFPGPGWNSAELDPRLDAIVHEASQQVFSKPYMAIGGGGSIPFMGLLAEVYPSAQFIVTGGMGNDGHAHGPNEFLDIEYCRKVITCISLIIGGFAKTQ